MTANNVKTPKEIYDEKCADAKRVCDQRVEQSLERYRSELTERDGGYSEWKWDAHLSRCRQAWGNRNHAHEVAHAELLQSMFNIPDGAFLICEAGDA